MNKVLYATQVNADAGEILTLDQDAQGVLVKPAPPFDLSLENERREALKIADILKTTLRPFLPAAGLASPQIGIARRLFIFSWDRSEENIVVVINPAFKSLADEKESSWEGCFSAILCKVPKIAKIPRYKKIQVFYTNEKYEEVSHILEGFSARVFLHEYDHLEGIVNIFHRDAEVKEFENKDQLEKFMKNIRTTDRLTYIPPQDAPPSIVRQEPVT